MHINWPYSFQMLCKNRMVYSPSNIHDNKNVILYLTHTQYSNVRLASAVGISSNGNERGLVVGLQM